MFWVSLKLSPETDEKFAISDTKSDIKKSPLNENFSFVHGEIILTMKFKNLSLFNTFSPTNK